MSRGVLLLILTSVMMSAVAQIVLKAGMSRISGVVTADRWSIVMAAATNPYVLLGLGIYFLGAVVWLLVLARVEVSLAYPFVGLGFIATMLLGRLVHGDTLSIERIAGTLLITLGVALMAWRG